MKIILAILILIYLILLVVYGFIINRKFKNKLVTEQERLSIYRKSIIETWVSAAVFVAVSIMSGFSLDKDIGFGFHFMQFGVNFVLTIVAIVIACGFAGMMILQIISLARNEEAQIIAWHKISNGGDKDAALPNTGQNLIMPRTHREKNTFVFVAISAGICEEITMRGVLFIVVQSLLPNIPLVFVPLIAGVVFGVAHSYQGLTGVIKTGLVGVGFGYLYLATGSLIPGILLHFLVDYNGRFLFPKSFE